VTNEHRVLITGADGFAGRWLQREFALRSEGLRIEVIAVGHGPTSEKRVDVTDYPSIVRLVSDCRPTAVVHLAAIASPTRVRSIPQHALNVNVTGTMNLAYAIKHRAPDARLIYASSSEVYGLSFNDACLHPISETAPMAPTTTYGVTKVAAEALIAQMSHEGLKAVRFRAFNHIGPGQALGYVVADFAKQIAQISAGHMAASLSVGHLDTCKDFLDVRDVVRAYADAALSGCSEINGRVFNLATGVSTSVRDILQRLIDLTGVEVEILVDPLLYRTPEVPVTAGCADAVYEALGWRPEIELTKTLADVLNDWHSRIFENGRREVGSTWLGSVT
jgi:GDP-4-dehydro-6-deoxy-D-mannose reductase